MSRLDLRLERRRYREALDDEADRSGSLRERLEAMPSGPGSTPPKIPQRQAAYWNRKFHRERGRLVKMWLLYDDAEAEVADLRAELAVEQQRSLKLAGMNTAHEEELLVLREELEILQAEGEGLRARVAELEMPLASTEEPPDERSYARSVIEAARPEDRSRAGIQFAPLFDRWDRWSGARETAAVAAGEAYQEGDYTLHAVDVAVAGGGSRTFYFFSRETPERGEPVPLPEGYEVGHNPRNGLPFLRRAD